MAKDCSLEFANILYRGRYLAGICFPVLIDKCLTTVLDNMDVNIAQYNYYSLKVPRGNYQYIEYCCPFGKFHIKRVNKKGNLPKATAHRLSNAESNKIFLNLGDNYIPKNINTPFALITYTHKNFRLQSISLGFPNYEYTDWQDGKQWELSLNFSDEIANVIDKNQVSIKAKLFDVIEEISPSYANITKK